MNFTKKIAAATAAIALTASFASAQAVGTISVDNTDWANYSGDESISFSVAVTQQTLIEVSDEALEEDVLPMDAAGNVSAGNLVLAGVINIQTNMAAWDVTVNAVNGGKLLNTSPTAQPNDFLKIVKNGVVSDAILRINACAGTEHVTGTLLVSQGTPDDECDAPTNIAQNAVIGAAGTLNPSLSTVLAKVGGFKLGVDTNDDGEAHIGIYAALPATEDELAGNGTYTEQLEFTLVSWY